MFSPLKTFKYFLSKDYTQCAFYLTGDLFLSKSKILMFITIGKFSAILSFKISFRIHLIFFIGCSCSWLDGNVLCTFISCDSELLFLPCLCMPYLEGSPGPPMQYLCVVCVQTIIYLTVGLLHQYFCFQKILPSQLLK